MFHVYIEEVTITIEIDVKSDQSVACQSPANNGECFHNPDVMLRNYVNVDLDRCRSRRESGATCKIECEVNQLRDCRFSRPPFRIFFAEKPFRLCYQ